MKEAENELAKAYRLTDYLLHRKFLLLFNICFIIVIYTVEFSLV